MRVYKELGYKKVWRFFWLVPILGIFNILGFPNLRGYFLKLSGAKIGKDVVIHKIKIFNLYASKFSKLRIGNSSFLGNDCFLDLANGITLGNHVTLSERVTIMTHTNVGYKDHPLQKYFPRKDAPVEFKDGCFIGANTTILPGVVIGERAFIGAGSVVTKPVPSETVVAGVPAKFIKKINEHSNTYQ